MTSSLRSGRVEARRAFDAPDELFARFPYGLFTTDANGRVLAMNDVCRGLLLGEIGPGERRLGCCELVCDWITGADESSVCLSQRARTAGEPLPEVRIDLAPEGPASAAWVTAAPLDDGERIVFHLRPGTTVDRRSRQFCAQSLENPRLRIFTFGQTRIENGLSEPPDRQWMDQRPGELFKYLVCAGPRPVPAEEIATALWPQGDARALSSVRHFVHILRKKLEPGREARATSAFIDSARGGYAVNPQRVWVDANEFEHLVSAGLSALSAGLRDTALGRLESALDLYRGDFLADEPYAEWALFERERLRELAGRALRAAVELRIARDHRCEIATRHARRLADLEPYDADAQRRHIELCILLGRKSEAARRYDLYRRRMASDFGEEPAFALAELDRAD
jgi:DNA-binding SARP family transcriptional activator